MTTENAFKLADELARGLRDVKYQFSAIRYSTDSDDQKIEALRPILIRMRREIVRVELTIFGDIQHGE